MDTCGRKDNLLSIIIPKTFLFSTSGMLPISEKMKVPFLEIEPHFFGFKSVDKKFIIHTPLEDSFDNDLTRVVDPSNADYRIIVVCKLN